MTFEEQFEGTFENELQAKAACQFSWIVVKHKKLDNGMFECTSAYKYDEDNPYKKSWVMFVHESERIVAKSYDPDTLTYKEDCDIIFTLQEDGSYLGRNSCKRCFVEYGDRTTYVITSQFVTPDTFYSVDIGVDVETGELLWGSKHGHFKFTRLCSSVGQSRAFVKLRSGVQVRPQAYKYFHTTFLKNGRGEILVEYLSSEGSTIPLQRIFPNASEAGAFAESLGNLYLFSYTLDGHENATVNEE